MYLHMFARVVFLCRWVLKELHVKTGSRWEEGDTFMESVSAVKRQGMGSWQLCHFVVGHAIRSWLVHTQFPPCCRWESDSHTRVPKFGDVEKWDFSHKAVIVLVTSCGSKSTHNGLNWEEEEEAEYEWLLLSHFSSQHLLSPLHRRLGIHSISTSLLTTEAPPTRTWTS